MKIETVQYQCRTVSRTLWHWYRHVPTLWHQFDGA